MHDIGAQQENAREFLRPRLNDPKVKEELAGRGFEVVASSPETLAAFLAEQSEIAGRLTRAAGIKPE